MNYGTELVVRLEKMAKVGQDEHELFTKGFATGTGFTSTLPTGSTGYVSSIVLHVEKCTYSTGCVYGVPTIVCNGEKWSQFRL